MSEVRNPREWAGPIWMMLIVSVFAVGCVAFLVAMGSLAAESRRNEIRNNERRYTIVFPDGRPSLHGVRAEGGDYNWRLYAKPGGERVYIWGPHAAIEELSAEAIEKEATR